MQPTGSDSGDGGPAHELSRRAFVRSLITKASVGLGAFALGYAVDAVWARLVRGPRLERVSYPRFILGGFRVHHNVVGYMLLVAGAFVLPVLLIPLGLGMIVGHGRRDRLYWFIEKID